MFELSPTGTEHYTKGLTKLLIWLDNNLSGLINASIYYYYHNQHWSYLFVIFNFPSVLLIFRLTKRTLVLMRLVSTFHGFSQEWVDFYVPPSQAMRYFEKYFNLLYFLTLRCARTSYSYWRVHQRKLSIGYPFHHVLITHIFTDSDARLFVSCAHQYINVECAVLGTGKLIEKWRMKERIIFQTAIRNSVYHFDVSPEENMRRYGQVRIFFSSEVFLIECRSLLLCTTTVKSTRTSICSGVEMIG